MPLRKTQVAILIGVTLLQGCVSQSYLDNKKQAEQLQQHMDEIRPTGVLANVESITRPPINTTPIEVGHSIAWLSDTVSVHVAGLPLSLVLDTVLKGVGAQVAFANDVQANTPVTINADTTRQNILNLLSSQTGYGFVPTEHRLSVQRYLTETFIINLPTGSVTSQQGSQGETKGEGEKTKVEGQFISVSTQEQNTFNEISAAVRVVLKSDSEDNKLIGDVQAIPSMGSITVRTTPSRMAQVRQVVETFQHELAKQVLLEITVLEFRSNLGKDHGIDWQLLKNVGSGTLKFLIPGTTATATGSPSGLAFSGTGKWDGTTAFIKALEEQGTVSTQTPISMLTISGQPARISQTITTPYLSDVSTQVTETTTSTSTTRDKVVEGVDMMVNAKVQKGVVSLRITGKLTKIAGDTTEKVSDATLRFIKTRSADLSFVNKLRYGQTVVIGSIKQQSTGANKSASFGIDGLGMQSTTNETVETLVLLTPRRTQ
ncbi:type II and III secretion system protein [Photobacterium damselae subsp. piscicida]|uniref:type II secretion system protein GspD n=1 Tax=Photobacterium damselae TaxID=38293 RepID=UPI00107631EF|nr:type II and III secretion system protein [Photobacterium damselae]TFZ62423.1 type II and III secretion system protein [Photobacterium damselae subsp. piscicida]